MVLGQVTGNRYNGGVDFTDFIFYFMNIVEQF